VDPGVPCAEPGGLQPGLQLGSDPRADLATIQAGKLGGTTFTATLGNGGEEIQFNPGFTLPANVKAKADELIKGITEGTINVPQ